MRKSKKATETSTETTATTATTATTTTSIPREAGPRPQIVTRRATLRDALALVLPVTDKGSAMPVLSNVLLRAGDGALTVAATDLNVTMTVEIPATVDRPGGITLPAKRALDVVKAMTDPEATLAFEDGRKATLRAGRVSVGLFGIHDRDYPKIPDATADGLVWRSMPTETLADMFDAVLFSVCKDETRFHLNGVCVESTGSVLRMITTDGHRLTKVARALEYPVEAMLAKATRADGSPAPRSEGSASKIIPAKGAAIMRKVLGLGDIDSQLAITTTHTFLRVSIADIGHVTVIAKHIDAQFPAYEAVIPKAERLVSMRTDDIVEAIKRARVMAVSTRGVVFRLGSGEATIEADDPDVGSHRETMSVDYVGPEYKIGFNPAYMLEALAKIDGTDVVFGMGANALDPISVRSLDDASQRTLGDALWIGVVMPMRV